MEAVPRRTHWDAVDFARRTIRQEADALHQLAARLGDDFAQVIAALERCQGAIVVTGMGKAGLIGQKASATLCSTGCRSFFLHPAEAIHGDLGRVAKADLILAFSMSGETEELTKILPSLRSLSAGIVAITSNRGNSLARQSDHVIELGRLQEADANGLAPSTSTTAMLAIGDAIAFTLSKLRDFRPQDFVRFHPGGSLGRKLTRVQEVMRPITECRVALPNHTVRETIVSLRKSARRSGAVMIVDDEQLVGIFTDSDLAKLLERQTDPSLEVPIQDVMTRQPLAIEADSLMPLAIQMLAENQISELPVVDHGNRPLGLIDITDVVGWFPDKTMALDAGPTLLPFPITESPDRQ